MTTACRAAGHEPRRYPLLALKAVTEVEPDTRARALRAAEPHLALAVGAVSAGCHGTAITRSLVAACRDRGVDLVFLSAKSDAAAELYRRVGFVDVGTACILEPLG